MKQSSHPFVRFLMVGGLATALHYVILIGLVQWGGLGATLSSSLGFAVSALVNYLLNRRFTFKSDASHAAALPRFATIALTGLVLNAAVMASLVQLHVPYLLAQAVATATTVLWNYALNRRWTFSNSTSATSLTTDRKAAT